MQGMINLSVTSSTEPEQVKEQLVRVFEKHNMKYEVNGSVIFIIICLFLFLHK